jgi:hypothetical protein
MKWENRNQQVLWANDTRWHSCPMVRALDIWVEDELIRTVGAQDFS